MSYVLEVAIHPAVTDNAAYTVLVALRRLGYPELDRVERAQILRLSLGPTADSPERVVAALVRAEVLFNPNKDRLAYNVAIERENNVAIERENNVAIERSSMIDATAGRVEYEAIVAYREDDTARLVFLLSRHFGIRDLDALSRGVAWTLFERDGPAQRERLEWACNELLCNPRSQTLEIRGRPGRIFVGEREPTAANRHG